MNFIGLEMLLAAKNKELRHAVQTHSARNSAAFYKDLEGVGTALEEWAGKRLFREGRKPISAILATNEMDYATQIGIGIFLEAEKYNDMRGWLLDILEAADAVRQENEGLKAREIKYMATEFWLVDASVGRWPRSKVKRQAAYEKLRKRLSFSAVIQSLDDTAARLGLDGHADREDT